MNKLMKMATVVVGVGAMLNFAGCGASNNPGEIAAGFFNTILDGKDVKGYIENYGSDEMIKKMNEDIKGFTENYEKMKDIKKEMAKEMPLVVGMDVKVAVKDVKIDGEEAKVQLEVKITGKNKLNGEAINETTSGPKCTLKKMNGKWKFADID